MHRLHDTRIPRCKEAAEMRMRVCLDIDYEVPLPSDHQHLLRGAIYHLLELSDPQLAAFLHDEGYAADGDTRRYKLFCFSGIRGRNRRLNGPDMVIEPGPVEWLVGSASDLFLQHIARGLQASRALVVGKTAFSVRDITPLRDPDFSAGKVHLTCLSPIVASVPRPPEEKGGARYLRPADGDAFSDVVRRNLMRKHEIIFGHAPADGSFYLAFDTDYLARRRGTRLVEYDGISVVGALAPFQACGDPALLQLGYDCGFGEKNSSGFGMVDLDHRSGNERS